MGKLRTQYAELLAPFLPEDTSDVIARWIVELRVSFVVTKPRKTKLGDFRVSANGKNHRISVNGDLNPYAFLVTTIHEFAHLGCFLKHRNTVSPHGDEWKAIFADLLHTFIDRGVFPQDLSRAIRTHLKRPKASSCSCPVLSRALARYDESPTTFLGDLKPGDVFVFNDVEYEYVEKRRTRCLCKNIAEGRDYLISVHAPILVPSISEN